MFGSSLRLKYCATWYWLHDVVFESCHAPPPQDEVIIPVLNTLGYRSLLLLVLTCACILVADEPTSGLDARSAQVSTRMPIACHFCVVLP